MSSVCNKSAKTVRLHCNRVQGGKIYASDKITEIAWAEKNCYENDVVTQLIPSTKLSEICINTLLQMRHLDMNASRQSQAEASALASLAFALGLTGSTEQR